MGSFSNAYRVVLLACFCVVTALPFFDWLLTKDGFVTTTENRDLKQRPAFPESIEALEAYPGKWADYYADQFGFRDDLVNLYKATKYQIGDSTSDLLIRGKEDWLFLGSIKLGVKRYSDPIGDYRRVNLYDEQALKIAAQDYQNLYQWLKEQGIAYRLFVTPNKHTVYSEYLPEAVSPQAEESSMDQLIAAIRQAGELPMIDLREPLRAAKGSGQLYHKHDSHWNSRGANVAQYSMLKSLAPEFPNEIHPRIFPLDDAPRKRGDLAKHLGVVEPIDPYYSPRFEEPCHYAAPPRGSRIRDTYKTECDRGSLKLLVFRDSYFGALLPYFSQQFGEVVYYWGRLDLKVLEALITEHEPDIVIEQYVERVLPRKPYYRKLR